ncbi:RecQ-mediated genome instability protein-like protein [Hapsidospora chrysogenum ATCC 11550]|uniref:RecQ-mediated genome instability protein-like protein n=1 Tax=Hapsidospora chrysogenum (strain ATCC 11550 / CBS 779.69 / DSM 880 / IAM 14645 / JCM 23072 / IMI 49137) TaxID=857340 RepID=A0A086T8M5_HAPC1|nr:RecQ-mediated genome instability protein-like protein [Hapsidospora chrysogenum ATCC 11550]
MDLQSQLKAAIISQSLPTPSPSLLTSVTTSRNPPPPLPSLIATAKARLLACDLTSSTLLDPSTASLPLSIADVQAKEARLPRDVHVQVVDVENLSLSRWEQVEELEAVERGERTRGREVVRVTAEDGGGSGGEDNDDNEGSQTQQPSTTQRRAAATAKAGKTATHRLVLQDRNGKRVFALETQRMERIGVGTTCMGEKVLLKAGAVVARGTVLLTPETCVFLGGKIDAWHKAWMEGRLTRLREAVGSDRPL